MAKFLDANGGTVVKDCAVTKILVEGGKAKGVELANGDTVLADKAVVSNTCPQETFFDLIGKEHFDEKFIAKVDAIQPDMLVPFVNVQALNEPPNWKAAEQNPEISKSFLMFTLCDTVSEFMTATHDAAEGKLPLRSLRAVTPAHSLLDPGLAPEGKHTSGSMVMVPPVLKEGFEKWDEVREEFSDTMLEHVSKFAPNLAPGSPNILANAIRSPLDVARDMSSMFLGSWVGGSQAPDQMGRLRPYPTLKPYRTPIEKLYLCGMHNHPVGGVSGASGYNAANAIAEDFKVKKWWKPFAPTL
jgi:phytoene dehydrogenase-like protein